MRKSFVLDTNVLLHSSAAVTSFADNEVVIPFDVIEELDKFKTENNELGRNARAVIRFLDRLRGKGSLRDGVPIEETGGSLRVTLQPASLEGTGLSPDVADNRIISIAWDLHKRGEKVVFVSKDINARIKSDTLGIKTMDFEKQKVDFDQLYAGWREIKWPRARIDAFYGKKSVSAEGMELSPNEFAFLVDEADEKHTALARCSPDARTLVLLPKQAPRAMGISPRNKEQRMAMDLLSDQRVEMVTLVGQAGTGKTLLALACGLAQVVREERYERVLVARPIMPLGKDIGFLPGGKEAKLSHWMMPIYDNLDYLLSQPDGRAEERPRSERAAARKGKKDRSERDEAGRRRVERLIESGAIELEALTYIRGRSIPGQFMIVDEAQNLTPHEVKTIISRAGEGTKVVLTGDPYQIDNPYLDASSNGLTYAAERLRGHALVGHITFTRSERSPLASLAAEAL